MWCVMVVAVVVVIHGGSGWVAKMVVVHGVGGGGLVVNVVDNCGTKWW